MSDAAISDFEEFWGSFESVKTSEKADKKASEKKYIALKIVVFVLGFFLFVEVSADILVSFISSFLLF